MNCEDMPFKAGDSYLETAQDIEITLNEETGEEIETVIPIPLDTTIESSVRDANGVLHELVVTIAVDRLSYTLTFLDTSSWAKGIAKRDIKYTEAGLISRTKTDTFLIKEFITP